MLRIEIVNAIAELERYGWGYEPAGNNEIKFRCPCHDDSSPSASLNTENNLWHCLVPSCAKKGDIVSLLAYIGSCERKTVIVDLLTRYPDLESTKVINQERVEKYHQDIWKAGPFLQALYDRGVTDGDIKEARLGFSASEGRIIIPVYNMQGQVVNLRKYLPSAPGPEKFRNIRGYTTMAIYQPKQLSYPTLWICGGELKALVAKRFLNPLQTGAISVTAGEGNWDSKFNQLLKGKHIFICMDVDKAGVAARRILASALYSVAASIHFINLPLDSSKYPKGDINDWVAKEAAAEADFQKAMQEAVKFIPPTIDDEDNEIITCKLIDAARAEQMGKRINCKAMISALDSVPFIVPKVLGVRCTRDQAFCTTCRINAESVDEQTGLAYVTLKPTNAGILEMINVNQKNLKAAMQTSINAPGCRNCDFFPQEFYNVLDCRLTTPLELVGDNGDNKEHIVQPAYMVTNRHLDLNTPYCIQGRPFPHPLTSQAVLLVDRIQETEDSLASCTFTKTDSKHLQIFQPEHWTTESLQEKLEDIYTDLAFNVTRIFKRRDLHLAFDFTYHSVLFFPFEGRIQNGWTNCLVTGDSSQGKSEIAIRLIEHYGLGIRHDCKNATEAGLLGGLQQIGSRWFVVWGMIPLHDKQLVVLEEIKGADLKVLGRLTDMRSSGKAQITKIERRSAYARTRLMMLSNPRSDRAVSAYTYGIEIIKELIGNLEDIRRFDFALIVSAKEIDSREINQFITENKPQDPHYYSDICRKAVLWAWTRTPEQIEFEPTAEKLCLEKSLMLCKEFTESIPLCDKGTMRYKLARLAIALACRTFSSDSGQDLQVRPCHVEYVTDYLLRNYTNSVCGYKDFSQAERYTSMIDDEEAIVKRITSTKYPKDFVEQLLRTNEIVLNDICDWCEVSRDVGQSILSLLVRKRALFRNGLQYEKSSGFIELLKKLLTQPLEQVTYEGDEF